MPTAPTPAYINTAGHAFGIQCLTCRDLTYPKDFALALVLAGNGDVPVDQLRFRCKRCGGPGLPWVTASGHRDRRLLPPPDAEKAPPPK